MPKAIDTLSARAQINIMDAFLYILAVGSMIIISISFLLWLRF